MTEMEFAMKCAEAERAFMNTPIYREMHRRRNELRKTFGLFRDTGAIDVTAEELATLEEAAPVWMRWKLPNGNFSLGPLFATEFRVV